MQRRMMQKHMDNGKDSHLNALAAHVKTITQQFQTQLHTLATAIAQITPQPTGTLPHEFVLDNFEQKKSNDEDWFSPSFHTHIGGYKMCLKIIANGRGDSKGTHVGVAVNMMRGEFDDHLQWPFKGEIKVQLINQREGGEPFERKVVSEDDKCENWLCRVHKMDRAEKGWGKAKFISHSDLYKPEKGKEYLKNDRLIFKVTTLTVKSISRE